MKENNSMLLTYENFVEIYGKLLEGNGIPSKLWETLFQKLSDEVFDAGDYFMLTKDEDDILTSVCSQENGYKPCNTSVFLVDHAVTYQSADVRKLLEDQQSRQRVASIVNYSNDMNDVDQLVKKMWKYNQTYSILDKDNIQTPLWYLLDEFGSAIYHSDQPNVAMVPFYYHPLQTSVTVMWLLKDVDYAEPLVRDFVPANLDATNDELMRKCKLTPWIKQDLTHIPSTPTIHKDKNFQDRSVNETLPSPLHVLCEFDPDKKSYKVYYEGNQPGVTDNVTFERVDDVEKADIVWQMKTFRDFKKWSEEHPEKLINQFPCEHLMINKDFFAAMAMRNSDGKVPRWLPLTFNLHSELPQFLSYNQQHSGGNPNKVWIVKPWNLARGLGIEICKNVDHVVRLRETSTPKVVCEYIENPVLYRRSDIDCSVKFTMRIYVALKSVAPLRVFASKLVRMHFANKDYEMGNFDEYDRHFTVMNYFEGGRHLREIGIDEFVPNFHEQNPGEKWQQVVDETYKCVSEFFHCATNEMPPYGIGHYSNSRALYGFDVLLKWKDSADATENCSKIQPMLLECNFIPDCTQTCKTDPQFMNKIFKFLFADRPAEECDLTDISNM